MAFGTVGVSGVVVVLPVVAVKGSDYVSAILHSMAEQIVLQTEASQRSSATMTPARVSLIFTMEKISCLNSVLFEISFESTLYLFFIFQKEIITEIPQHYNHSECYMRNIKQN